MAAEPAAIRTLLGAHGVSRQVTRDSITTELGLNSVQAWVTSMAGDPTEFATEVRRQLRDLIKDGRAEVPPVPPAMRPDVNPSTLAGITNFAQTISFYAQRGQPIGVNIVANANHANAVSHFSELFALGKAGKPTEEWTLPLLDKGVEPNSTKYADWLKAVNAKLATYLSADGHTPASYIIRDDSAITAWADIDLGSDVLTRQTLVAPMAGHFYIKDNEKFFAALQIACEHVGLTQVNHFETRRDGRRAYLAHKSYLFGDDSEEEKIKLVSRAIEKKVHHSETCGLSFHDHVTVHQEAHQQMADLGAPCRAREEVENFLNGVKCKS